MCVGQHPCSWLQAGVMSPGWILALSLWNLWSLCAGLETNEHSDSKCLDLACGARSTLCVCWLKRVLTRLVFLLGGQSGSCEDGNKLRINVLLSPGSPDCFSDSMIQWFGCSTFILKLLVAELGYRCCSIRVRVPRDVWSPRSTFSRHFPWSHIDLSPAYKKKRCFWMSWVEMTLAWQHGQWDPNRVIKCQLTNKN